MLAGKGEGGCEGRPGMDMALMEMTATERPITDMGLLSKKAARSARHASSMQWRTPDQLDRQMAELSAAELGIHPITALRLEKERFPGDDYSAHRDYLHPHIGLVRSGEETCPGTDEAAEYLRGQVKGAAKVALFSDYDVDGTTSMEIMRRALKGAGAEDKQLICQWASARDGFGLTDEFVRSAARRGAKTLVVMDCGSSQSEQVALAQSLGMKVVVVDHHQLDPDNPADFHLNPHLASQLREKQALQQLAIARKQLKQGTELKQQLIASPDDQEIRDRLDAQAVEAHKLMARLDELSGASEPSSKLKVAIDRLSASLDDAQRSEPSTGATLTWKLGREIVGEEKAEEFQGQAMYLAGMGAVADMADMRHPESRAFLRVPLDTDPQEAVPVGVEVLAEHMDEDPTDPGSLMRTRAALNLPKRTTRVEAEMVGKLLGAKRRADAERYADQLMDAYQQANEIREQMQQAASRDWGRRRQQSAKEPYFASAVIDGFPDDVGQSGVIAGRMAREHQKPAVVFTERSTGQDGEKLYKFSVRNGVVKGAKIGRMLTDKQLQKACTLPGPDGGESVNLGGHSDVVSGACTAENIPAVLERLEKWASGVDSRQGFTSKRRGAVWLTERMVDPAQLPRLEKEARLLRPTANNNYPTRVSVALRATEVGELDKVRGTRPATVELPDGTTRQVNVANPSADLLRSGAWLEAAISLGERQWWLRDLRPIDKS